MLVNKEILKEGLRVHNAGLVILNTYIPMLFERLGLTVDRRFSDSENQMSAVHYLQYVATGLMYTEEYLLDLNKVLCGIPLTQTLTEGINISNDQQMLMESLLQSIIGSWPEIGRASLDGFRGNWLVRDGLLTEKGEGWELTVEKRAYDILIQRSPFSFSVIRYPWMDKPLHIKWPI